MQGKSGCSIWRPPLKVWTPCIRWHLHCLAHYAPVVQRRLGLLLPECPGKPGREACGEVLNLNVFKMPPLRKWLLFNWLASILRVPTLKPGLPAPCEHTGNSVAYPLESHLLLQRLGARAQDLPRFLTILFEGEDRNAVREDKGLKVCTTKLRCMFRWLLFNCWPWLEATRTLRITNDHFGEDIETAINSYATPSDVPCVPEVLVQTAASSGSTDSVRPAKGPADAVASDSDAEDGSGCDKKTPETSGATEKKAMPFHAAVLETSMESVSILQEWNQIFEVATFSVVLGVL